MNLKRGDANSDLREREEEEDDNGDVDFLFRTDACVL